MAELPVVTLAGKEYRVPVLVPRQLREVLPATARMVKRIADAEGDPTKVALSKESLDDLYTTVFWGVVWPNDKAAKFEEFLDSPVTLTEIHKAVVVVREQTGIMKKTEPGEEPKPGE